MMFKPQSMTLFVHFEFVSSSSSCLTYRRFPTFTLCLLFMLFFTSPRSYPDREQLQTIYSAYLQPVLQHSLGGQAAWASTGKTHQLAGSLVQLYEQVVNLTKTFIFE